MQLIDDLSRTFREFLLLPGRTTAEHVPSNVRLRTPLAKFRPGKEESRLYLNIPVVSSAMQAVTGTDLAIALARKGGCGFVFSSQSVSEQAQMVRDVKDHKAGFVQSDSNLAPSATLQDALNLRKKTGHSTIAITADGTGHSRLMGILTDKDFWEFKDDLTQTVEKFYTPLERLVTGKQGISLQEATEILWRHKKECLPIVDSQGCLKALVFRKDFFDHKSNPDELSDVHKRLVVGAALNTHDYSERAAALIEAGVDCLVLDSSDGFTDWQKHAALELRKKYGSSLILGGGNIVCAEAFKFMVEECELDFVKVGIGGGSICITREQKGIGRGQASAVMDVVAARNKYFEETGIYVPVCSDGGLNADTDIMMALAMGADFVMMGKYFAMTAESPTPQVTHRGRLYKPYWGEGSNRARNWQRYKQTDGAGLVFEEGVDAYVPYSGPLADKLSVTLAKLKSTMCNLGVLTLSELHDKARVTRVSEMTLIEGGTSSVENLDRLDSEIR